MKHKRPCSHVRSNGCWNQSEEGDGKTSLLNTRAAVTATAAGPPTVVGTLQRDAGGVNAPRLGDGTAPRRQKPPSLSMKFDGDPQQFRFFLAHVLTYV
ncbi:hypothetical protein E2320_004508 [Naja naja]|nr:hypothetical protein E2320_004508 [Naja naja]